MSKIIARECKFVVHLPFVPDYREDTHVVKETLHYEDGTYKDNLRTITNFRRPFYITKPFYQKHKDKKESEELDRLNRYTSTDSDLGRNIAARLGSRYNGITDLRGVKDNPYIYGADITAASVIKHEYQKRYPDAISLYTYATLDIETNVLTDEITMVSLVMEDKIHTTVTRKYIKDTGIKESTMISKLDYLFEKYVPDTEGKAKVTRTLTVVENEMDLVRDTIGKAHEWGPDFVGIWNIEFDLGKMMKVCEKYHVDPADVFSDPSLPKNLRYFKYKQGMKQHVTESGKVKPINPEEQWHSAIYPAKFYMIDAMSAHRYVRVGGKSTPGGYSLDNILEQELGSKFKKLKFGDNPKYKGIEWHLYMNREKPLEYIIYNMWDCYSMIELDKKTKDLSTVLPMLSGISSYTIFNSGPKKIVDAMHYVYLEKGKVIGTKPARISDDKLLGLDDWIWG